MLYFLDQTPFASGCAAYEYRPAALDDTTPRIMIRVDIEGVVTGAFLDTGSPYMILNPEIAEALHIDIRGGLSQNRLLFRGNWLAGYLHRVNVRFIAEEGENVTVEATVFIPDLLPGQEYGNFPSVIGMNACLERLRFAVDPSQDTFYFGALP